MTDTPGAVDQLPSDPAAEVTSQSWLTLAITSTVGFMVSIEITVIALALPDIRAAFPSTAEATLSWIITAYNIGLASLLMVAGWASDRHGHKAIFLVGLTIFAAASLGAGLASSIEALIAARIVQAVGGAMQFPAGLALLLAAFPPARRQMAIGIWGAMGALAAAAGPPLGGFLVGAFGWRSVFLVNVPIALAATVAGFLWLLPSTPSPVSGRVDLFSIPLGTIGVGLVVFGVVQGPEWGWANARTVVPFVAAIVMITGFVVRSRRHPVPLFDLDLFSLRTYTIGNIGSVLFVVAFFAFFVPMPTFLQEAWGWSTVRTGLVLVPGPLLAAIISPLAGRLAERRGPAVLLTIGGVAGVVSMALHLALIGLEPSAVAVIVANLVLGIAAGCSFAMLVGATMLDVPPARFGMAGAGRTTVFQLAIALSIALAVAVIGRPGGPDGHLDAIRAVWVVCLAMFAGQAVLFSVVFPRSGSSSEAPSPSGSP